MEEMRKVTVRLPAKMFAQIKAETGQTNAGVLRLALETLLKQAARRRMEDPSSDDGVSQTLTD